MICSLTMGQTTGLDWTKTDCGGTNHHLFAELDNGKVTLIEYFEVGCSSCIFAGNYLDAIYSDYLASNPNRVNFYAMPYNAAPTCTDAQSWKNNNGFSCTTFTDGSADISYYGGMGMPTIVVLGGLTHHVYYKKLGFVAGDDPTIRSAIDVALANSGVPENTASMNAISAYPNPSASTVTINYSLRAAGNVDMVIYNILGEKMKSIDLGRQQAGENKYLLNTKSFAKGIYVLQLNTGSKREVIRLTVAN